MIPVTGFVARRLKQYQRELMKAKDERIKSCSEVLGGMRAIKMQGWENSFEVRVGDLRATEIRLLRRYLFLKACSSTLWNATPLAVSLATFTAYAAAGNELDVATALTSLALFQILRSPLFQLPSVVNNVVEAMVTIDRLESFMVAEEHIAVGSLWGEEEEEGGGGGGMGVGAGMSNLVCVHPVLAKAPRTEKKKKNNKKTTDSTTQAAAVASSRRCCSRRRQEKAEDATQQPSAPEMAAMDIWELPEVLSIVQGLSALSRRNDVLENRLSQFAAADTSTAVLSCATEEEQTTVTSDHQE
jgi:ABC-type multidrug transport system fused ATPase/permease subunit